MYLYSAPTSPIDNDDDDDDGGRVVSVTKKIRSPAKADDVEKGYDAPKRVGYEGEEKRNKFVRPSLFPPRYGGGGRV